MDDLFTSESDVSLEALSGNVTPAGLPEASIRKRAAAHAVLSGDPEKAVENYRGMVAEQQTGGDAIRSNIAKDLQSKAAASNMKTVLGVLGDKTASLEEKKLALENARMGQVDTDDALATAGLVAPNPGETPAQEEVRIKLADSLKEYQKSRVEMQGVVNAHNASLPTQGAGLTMLQAAEAWMVPFATSKVVSSIRAEHIKSTGREPTPVELLKAVALPGSTKQALIEEMNSMLPAQRAEMMNSLRKAIAASSHIILPGDNSFSKMEQGDALLNGNYDNVDAFFDNITPLFDAIGMGGFVRNSVKRFRGAAKSTNVAAATAPTQISPDLDKALSSINPEDLAKMPQPPKGQATPSTKVADLEKERASLLGNSSGLAEKGAVRNLEKELNALKKPEANLKERAKEIQSQSKVSYKEAQKQAEKELADAEADYEAKHARLTQQLQANREAAKNEQRLAELDAQIEALKKSAPAADEFAVNPLADLISRVSLRSTVTTHNPAAVGHVYSFGNPDKARTLHASVVASSDDELAMALYGTPRHEAIADNILPQPITDSGVVLAKAPDIDRVLRAGVGVAPEILEALKRSGALNYTTAEAEQAIGLLRNDFTKASGMVLNEAMSSFKVEGNRKVASGVFGTSEGGFKDAGSAVAAAITSFRKHGVDTDNLELLGRRGNEFYPLDSKNVPEDLGEYYVRVNLSEEMTPEGLTMSEAWENNWNFFDRSSLFTGDKQGSLARWIITAGKLVDPIFTNAASRVSDYASQFEKIMLGFANDFATLRNKLAKKEQSKLDEYIKEANFNGIDFDVTDLKARGFTDTAIESLRSWRKYWDNHFYLENLDLVRTLSAKGFQKFVGGNTEMYVKPIQKNINATNVYDATQGIKVTPTRAELDDLYNTGGTLAALRRPEQINGELVEHVIVRNNLSEYSRTLTDNDQILNYKKGYYQIQYSAPKFIDEYSVVNGQTVRRAVAVAGDSYEAEQFAQRARVNNPANEYRVRSDDRSLSRDSDDWWDLNSAYGRIAQRHRGALLQDAKGINHLGDTEYIVDPATTAIRVARSISGRTIGRPFLEAAKARVLQRYGHVMGKNPVTKEVMWPNSIKEIGAHGAHASEDVKHARTMYEYINYLENGYINALDDTVKSIFNSLAAKLGELAQDGSKVAGKLERAVASAETLARPTSLAKNAVFTNYIALNPFRQLIVQPHGAVRMFAINPVAASKAWTKSVADYAVNVLTPQHASKEAKHFYDFVEESGMLSAVDKHNMVRGALVDAQESLNKVGRAVSKTVAVPRQLGFDAGERFNQLMHLGTIYHDFKAKGKNLDDLRVREEAYTLARSVSYSMNFAGDLPYNQNFMGFAMQFMQVPHKALFQIFDRQIPVGIRARLLLADVILFGGPTVLLSNILGGDILPEDEELRTLLLDGVEQWGLNKIWESVIGERSTIDYTSLNPYAIDPFIDIFRAFFNEGGAEQVAMNSPAGAFFFESGSKLQNLFRSVGRFFNIVEDPMELTDAKQVALDAARLLGGSGWSNAEKALYILEHDKRLNARGDIIDGKASHLDAIAQLFGFGSYDAKKMLELSMTVYETKQKQLDRWNRDYGIMMKYYSDALSTGNSDWKKISAVGNHILTVYKDDPKALEYMQKRFSADIAAGDGNANKVLKQVMELSGYVDPMKFKDKIRMAPMDEEQKKRVLDLVDFINNYKEGK